MREYQPQRTKLPGFSQGKTMKVAGIILLTAGLSWLVYFLVMLGNESNLVSMQYLESNNKPRLLALYAETSNGEDGTYLTGYTLRYIDLESGQKIAETEIDDEEDVNIYPVLRALSEENIWLIRKNQFIQGDKGYLMRLSIRDGQFKTLPSPIGTTYTVNEIAGDSLVKLTNQYNEPYCLQLDKATISEGECRYNYPQPYDTLKTAFILVNKTPGSGRSKLYFYKTDQPDPMQISVGQPGEQTLLYYLWFSHNTLSQQELEQYQAKLKPNEQLVPVYAENYLVNASVLFASSTLAVVMEKGEGKDIRFFCFDHTGKTTWKADGKTFEMDNTVEVGCRVFKNMTVITSKNYIFAMNNTTGKLAWKFKP